MEKIKAKVAELIAIYNAQYPDFDFSDITVKMNGRLTSTAGRAWLSDAVVEFSTSLYAANSEAFLADTVPHEVAHIVAFRAFGSRGHDNFWKAVAAVTSNTSRCHTYQVNKKAPGKTYEWKCACQSHFFSPQRQAWANKGKTYKCKKCNQILVEA